MLESNARSVGKGQSDLLGRMSSSDSAQQFVPAFVQRREILTGNQEPTEEECDWPSDEEKDEEDKLAVSVRITPSSFLLVVTTSTFLQVAGEGTFLTGALCQGHC